MNLFKFIKNTEVRYGKKIVTDALNITTEDIKFNKIGFNKITGPREFMDIFERSLNLCLKYS